MQALSETQLKLEAIFNEVDSELTTHVLPFWMGLMDHERGGFYGEVDINLVTQQDADKGAIHLTRYIWTFSQAYRILGDPAYKATAEHGYRFLKTYFLDPVHGGVYWMVNAKGQVVDDRKHVYAQSFAIYALSEFYLATGCEEARQIAQAIFNLVETTGFNPLTQAYGEEYTRSWQVKENEMLSENGVMATITMNTHLHLLEAYTTLYRAWPTVQVRNRIDHLLHLFEDKLLDPEVGYYRVFLNDAYEELLPLISFGHDIEATWLIDEAVRATGLFEDRIPTMILNIADRILARGIDEDGGLLNEKEGDHLHPEKVWWGQAEAMIGLLNAYERTGNQAYVAAIDRLWQYTKTHFIDTRAGGEWFWGVSSINQQPNEREIAGPWKAPYHVGRFGLEYRIRRNRMNNQSQSPKIHPLYTVHRDKQETLLSRKNPLDSLWYNGVYDRYQYPVLTRHHVPIHWRFDLNRETNPLFMERLGVNATFNAGAIYHQEAFYVMVRLEGVDRKSTFALAKSDNGIDGFRFVGTPITWEDTYTEETNMYDMRLVKHEDGYIYGIYCSEAKDPAAPASDTSSAVAQAGLVRTVDLVTWERLPNIQTASPQQRNVVLHPEFVDGKYAFYTRPQDGFISTGTGGGIAFGLSASMNPAVVATEVVMDERRYHTVYEVKNGQGPAPIKTDKGWIHIAHGVRNTAAGLRYVLYTFATSLEDPTKVTHKPGGHFIAPYDEERVGDVSNVIFCNGAVVDPSGKVYIYYASSDTRLHVATTDLERLMDYTFNTPEDPYRSLLCAQQRKQLVLANEALLAEEI